MSGVGRLEGGSIKGHGLDRYTTFMMKPYRDGTTGAASFYIAPQACATRITNLDHVLCSFLPHVYHDGSFSPLTSSQLLAGEYVTVVS